MEEKQEFSEVNLGEVIKMQEGDELVGNFISIEPSTQYEGSWAFRVSQNAEMKVVFVSKIVLDLVSASSLTKGQKCKLVYSGMKKNQLGTREYKDYKLFLGN